MADVNASCQPEQQIFYDTGLGFESAVPEWEMYLIICTLSLIIILTIVGNVLVILSVFTYKPLRIVQNFFIVSLAVADLTVAILVMPLNVAYSILGRWYFGISICKMWLTSDVMCCTASILNLCAIALDRFWAITDPINYAQKRTLKRVLLMIGGIWVLSLIISSPPLIGWNDWPPPDKFTEVARCTLTERQGYVIYSSLGSFFIPLFIMTIVYAEIFIATKRRLRERAQASKINAMVSRNQSAAQNPKMNEDKDSVSSEANDVDVSSSRTKPKKNKKAKKDKKGKKSQERRDTNDQGNYLKPGLIHEDSLTDNAEASGSHRKDSLNPCTSDTTTATTNTTTTTGSPQSLQLKSVKVEIVTAPKKTGAVYQFIEEKQRISLSKERRAARTLGIIMGVFVVCWLPFFLMYVIKPFCATCCFSNRLINFITWLGYINSALNPIIYTIFNLDFRRAFKKLLRLRF